MGFTFRLSNDMLANFLLASTMLFYVATDERNTCQWLRMTVASIQHYAFQFIYDIAQRNSVFIEAGSVTYIQDKMAVSVS